jgi:hypothetical protein
MSGIAEAVDLRSRRALRRSVTAVLGAAIVAVALASPAVGAQPNHQACLGHDIRTYAQSGSGFGAFVSNLADEGAGTEVQAHLAGLVPDESIDNSCND